MRRRSIAVAAALSVAVATAAEARGPWRGQAVDAETGQPVAGVIVVASWNVRTAGWPHPTDELLDVTEVVTDADGRFTIPARHLQRRGKPGVAVGPELRMFKAGYGPFRWRGAANPYPLDPDLVELGRLAEKERAKLEREGAVAELPPAKTRKERLAALERLGVHFPPELIPRLLEAYSRERVFLGLSPYPGKP